MNWIIHCLTFTNRKADFLRLVRGTHGGADIAGSHGQAAGSRPSERSGKKKLIIGMNACCTIALLFSLGAFITPVFAFSDNQAETEGVSRGSVPNIGNFALRSPQQPGPLLSFGQTLIGKNFFQLSLDTFSPYQIGGAFDTIYASMIYGISDTTSLYFSYPIQADAQTRVHRGTSLTDVSLQLEQGIYVAGNTRYQDQATLVGAITLPLQDASTMETVGYGAPTFFMGTTYNRTYVDWLGFVSPGVLITTTSKHIRLGSQFLYQAGLGRNIVAVTDKSMVFGLLELDGQYTEKDHIFGFANPNSGGNIIALTPSLWLSSNHFIGQVGVGFPIVQNLNGNQANIDYFIATSLSWTLD